MTEQPSAAAEQAQADADLTRAIEEEQLAADLAVDEQADAAVAADEAALDPQPPSSDSSTSSTPVAGTGVPSSASAAESSTTSSPAPAPSEPPAEEQGTAPTAGETADSPNVGQAVAAEAPVSHGLDDGDTSGGAGQYPTDPATNAPTDVVTPGTEGDQLPAAAPFDPTGGANAGTSIAPSQGTVPEPQPTNDDGSPIPTPDASA